MSHADDFGNQMGTLEERLLEVERGCDPTALEAVRGLVRAVLEVHQICLREILQIVGDAKCVDGTPVLSAICERPSIASLLLMHELHPDDLAARIERAVAEANAAATGQVRARVVTIDGRSVQLQIEGGPPAAAQLLRRVLERVSCEHAPDAVVQIRDVRAEAHASDPHARDRELIPLSRLHARATVKHS